MMSTSVEYARLELFLAEANIMIRHIHDHKFNNKTEMLLVQSYIMLCHAAIEEYLEDITLSILSICFNKYIETKVVLSPLLSVCASYKIDIKEDALAFNEHASFHDIFESMIRIAIARHKSLIDGNHGIKTKDQRNLFMPIGTTIENEDRLLSQFLNAFGEIRGQYAHSVGMKTLDPKISIMSKVANIQKRILEMDARLLSRCEISHH